MTKKDILLGILVGALIWGLALIGALFMASRVHGADLSFLDCNPYIWSIAYDSSWKVDSAEIYFDSNIFVGKELGNYYEIADTLIIRRFYGIDTVGLNFTDTLSMILFNISDTTVRIDFCGYWTRVSLTNKLISNSSPNYINLESNKGAILLRAECESCQPPCENNYFRQESGDIYIYCS